MATSGLYGNSPNGTLIAESGTESTGLYGKSPNGSVVAAPGSDTSGLYGNAAATGGTYFEWFVFQVSASQPATPTGGSWDFTTNVGTPPSGWSNAPASAPTNPVWISIGLVNSRSTVSIVWSTPGVFSYSGQLNGSAAPTSDIGIDGTFYIQTGVSPYAIWYKNSGTWVQVTGAALYVALTGDQTIGGTKTFSSLIQGSISGNAATATSATYATSAGSVPYSGLTGTVPTWNQNTTGTAANITATSNSTLTTLPSLSLPYSQLSGTVPTWNQNTTGNASTATYATSAGSVPYSGLTGTVPTWNQNTTGNAATATYATTAGSATTAGTATVAGNVTGIVAIANGGTGASTASTARTNLGLGTIATQNANAVAITGGAESGVTHSGDTIGTYLDYTGTSAPSYVEGRSWYDTAAHALAYYNDSANVVVHIGQDLQIKVINNTGSTIANGSPVYITGTSSGQTYPNIALAKADVAATSAVIGLTNGAIANGTIGYVTSQGGIDNVNTGTFTVGQVLYLSPYSAGQLMNTIPPTGITVQVGVVSFVNSSTGKIYVKQTTPLNVPASIISGAVAVANGGTGATDAAGARTNLGLGTIATQNANAVAITGGAIDNTPVGGTTPAAGTFTTLISNSTAQFGKSSANYVQAVGGATTVAPVVSALGSDTNIPLVLQPKGTGALQAQQTDSTATGGNARGANAVDWQMQRSAAAKVASATNSVIVGGYDNVATGGYSFIGGGYSNATSNTIATVGGGQFNAASGTLSAVLGGYANVAGGYFSGAIVGTNNTANGLLNFIGGGQLNSGTANGAVTTQSATMNGTTAVTLSGSNANIKVGQLVSGTYLGFPNYVAAISGTSLTLSAAATGSGTATLSFYTPHGVVVGGGNNQATGSYSFIGGGGDAGTAANRNVASGDWSFVGGGMKNTASGIGAVVVGGGILNSSGFANTASGNLAIVLGGAANSASNTNSFVINGYANTANGQYGGVLGGARGITRSISGNFVFSSVTPIADANGVTQAALIVLGKQTTDATPTVITSDGGAASTTNQVILPNNSAYYFRGTVVAGVTGGGNTKGWYIEGVIKRGANAAATALVGTPTVTSSYADAGASTWTIALSADTTNGGLAVTFTGQAGTTIRTVAKLETVEMTF